MTAEGDSEKISNWEHSFFQLNGINSASPDRSVTLQLIHDRIDSESLDKKLDEVLLQLIAREAKLRKHKGIASDALLYTKGPNAKKRYNPNSEKRKRYCTYPKQEGHKVSDCFRKQRGKPPGGQCGGPGRTSLPGFGGSWRKRALAAEQPDARGV